LKNISLLGATGSIGRSSLDVVREMPDKFNINAVASGNSWKELAEIAVEFKPEVVAVANSDHYENLKQELQGTDCRILCGAEGVEEAACLDGTDILLSAAVGAAGLHPTIAAIDKGIDIALANKETLVMAGEVVTAKVKENNVKLLPVDSEHSAVYQCLQCGKSEEVSKLVLTASGGPFRGRDKSYLDNVTREEALAHPTWNMGPKITIDSATLVNKALEVIEAHWLFGFAYDMIDVVVHPQSVVHSMVEYVDGSNIAQLGTTDMKIPIQYALTFPERVQTSVKGMSLAEVGNLTFEKPDTDAFRCLSLGYTAGRAGGAAPAVYSAANEAAVDLFLNEKIKFMEIPDRIEKALAKHDTIEQPTLEEICSADKWARNYVYNN
jgi:1-deoxy-D-xylulose-5-phosphate reductoisomerase